MSRDTFKAKGEECHLTENQKRNLQHAYENAEGLSLEDGGWQNDLSAVVETGSMIMWLLEQAFPDLFLGKGDKDELNK
tara:strand:+ start:257 stop:490 length:234 start_codon:yes stop_codon:yes gene_type:complete